VNGRLAELKREKGVKEDSETFFFPTFHSQFVYKAAVILKKLFVIYHNKYA
jgi:hypothetical protein